MLTLYHAPFSRSTTILSLIEELGIGDRITVTEVVVARPDGGGGADPCNPHPEGKVPYLVDCDQAVRERGAIVLYLTDMFPEAGLGRPAGHPQRGAYLGWLFYYQGVMEPVLLLEAAGVAHPVLQNAFRGMDAMIARLAETLDGQPYLLGNDFTAVDLLLSSPFHAIPDAIPQAPSVRAWIERCADRPSVKAAARRDLAGVA